MGRSRSSKVPKRLTSPAALDDPLVEDAAHHRVTLGRAQDVRLRMLTDPEVIASELLLVAGWEPHM